MHHFLHVFLGRYTRVGTNSLSLHGEICLEPVEKDGNDDDHLSCRGIRKVTQIGKILWYSPYTGHGCLVESMTAHVLIAAMSYMYTRIKMSAVGHAP